MPPSDGDVADGIGEKAPKVVDASELIADVPCSPLWIISVIGPQSRVLVPQRD